MTKSPLIHLVKGQSSDFIILKMYGYFNLNTIVVGSCHKVENPYTGCSQNCKTRDQVKTLVIKMMMIKDSTKK